MSSYKMKQGRQMALALLLSFVLVFTTFCTIGTIPAFAADGDEVVLLPELRIASVEELTGGAIQSLYRDEVYAGNDGKYYTTYRDINLKDPRVFNFEFTVDAAALGNDTPEQFLEKVSLQYGGLDLDEWVWDGYASRVPAKTTSVLAIATDTVEPAVEGEEPTIVERKSIVDNQDGTYTVSIAMQTDTAWETVSQNEVSNVPYDDYGAGRQFDFSTGQSADNRAWWQAGPLKRGVDTYTMTATVDGVAVAARDMHIAPYDGMYSWVEINEYAQSLIQAINGAEYPVENLDGQTTGLIAAGYVAVDNDGNFVKGNSEENVYVEVSVLGYGLTDNYKEENQSFNNYSRYNAIWNIAVAKDAETIEKYLNETVPAMNTDPQALIDEIKDQADEDIDLMQVYYQNNVHSDEVTGTDTMIKLTTDLIKGGKDGQKIAYKTWTLDDMDLYYRDAAEGAAQGEDGHVVKGGYSENGIFMQDDTRTDKVFDTKDALDNFIFVNTLCSNPDGKAGMRRTNRYAFDLNRDAVFSTMPETIALMKDLMKWDPLVENEWHGYVQQMLIEPCTAPHDPAYDYDLLQNNMLNLSYAAGLAATGSSGMQRFLVPWDHYDGGDWDDGGTIYSPMFAMLTGCYGFTIEFPYANLDSLDANDAINYAMVDELLHGETEFFPGNRLNGSLEDVDGNVYASHEEDIKYTSMRKSSLISKLETKVRGLENIDAKDTVDKYFIDKKKNDAGQMEDKIVGRARPTDASGNELSFFPDYIVIPTDDANQYNVAEGIKAMNQMIGWNIEVSMSTADVTYDGKTIPAGAYVLDMRQSRRNVIFEVMSKGYDATGFSSMYADIYCNLPDVRGFDSIQVYGAGLFDGKLEAVSAAEKSANIEGEEEEYVVFKSQSTDAVRFVNLLLSGHSSGPSTSEKGTVWMLRKDVKNVGDASDYVIKASDLEKINNLNNNAVLGLNGCHIEGKYIAELPAEAVKLVEPVIQLNTTRTSQTGGPLWWMLDDYLGFACMKDYNGTASGVRTGANVIISNSSKLDATQINAVKKGTSVIFIRDASSLNDENFGIGSPAPTTASFADVAIEGRYNVDDSLFTANYATTTTYYARGNKYYDIPEGAKVLFQSNVDKDEAFIGGFQATKGEKDVFANATTMFSTIIDNAGKPAQVLVIGQRLDYRPHYQKLLPMLATAIFADAAGIYDDFNAPVINEPKLDDDKCVITAEDADLGYAESGVKKLSVYLVKDGKERLIGESANGKVSFLRSDSTMKIKAVVVDYAGNETTKTFTVDNNTPPYIPTTPTGSTAPTIQKPIIEADDGANTDLSVDGTELTIQPKEGFEIADVVLNGKSQGAVTRLSGLKTGDKVVITTVKKVAEAEKIAAEMETYKLVARSKAVTMKDGSKAIRIKWYDKNGKKLNFDGVEIFRSTKRYSGYGKTPLFQTTKDAYYNTAIKAGTKYYYKVRGFLKFEGKKIYTDWSLKAWREV